MWSYLRNQRSKQTNLVYLQFLMHSFPKTGAEGCQEKNLEYGRILYNSTELSVDWTSTEFQNQTILFSAKIKFLI